MARFVFKIPLFYTNAYINAYINGHVPENVMVLVSKQNFPSPCQIGVFFPNPSKQAVRDRFNIGLTAK